MLENVLAKGAAQSLEIIGKNKLLKDAYMAGGTALALQLGHRYSYDFDFFTSKPFDEKIMVQQISESLSEFRLEQQEWRTILGFVGNTRFSLFFYKYPLLFPLHSFQGVRIADMKDIAAMKIAAIADRGIKRDFIDLYFILSKEKVLDLDETLKLYDKKFKKLAQNKVHILKSLIYFEVADKDDIPDMIQQVNWDDVRTFFLQEQKRVVSKLLNSTS